ncbi:serine hydrolase domain-containing protein [Microbulbifer variabilis]|uniref:serine hydrolase domain-containing protein n=1 Tax=Microbulbifer variabilis TaxID=266805 RepID=UPI001CFEED2E|nr:serine hydrolase domain-containing protein [Microbulbifer variabilis]
MSERGFTFISALIALLSYSACFADAESSDIKAEALFDAALDKAISEYNVPAISWVFVSPEEVIYQGVRGTRVVGGELPVSFADPMHIGSNTKAFTAYLAAIFVMKGKIDWDTHVAEIFPEIPKENANNYGQATLSNLLSHRAWIKPMTEEEEFSEIPTQFMDTKLSPKKAMELRKDFVYKMLELPPSPAADGKEIRYSNAGYVLAASMLEKVSGKPWEELMTEFVFKPLEINAIFGWPGKHDSRGVYGHIPGKDGQLVPDDPNGENTIPTILGPAGDLSLSALDYEKWLMENLRCLQGQSKVLTQEYCQLLHFGEAKDNRFPMGWGSKFKEGLGRVSTHSGSGGTFLSYALIFADKGRAIGVTFNSANVDANLAFKDIYPVFKEALVHGEK